MKKDISIENTTFSYGLSEENLLDGINLNIEKGKFIGILGPNGCGKSTLLKVILKYLNPKEGIIKIENKELKEYTQSELAEILSFVPQKSSLTMPLTVEDVVYMGRVPYIKNRWTGFDREDREKVEKIMQMLKIDKFKNRVIFSLSGGEFQRVLLARALAQNTNIMLLDEPTSALDMNYALEIMRLTSYFVQNESLTAVMVLHDLNLASMYCDSIILLKNGKIAYEGTPKELFRPEILEEIYGFNCEVIENNGFSYVIPNKI
ncbi:MAG: ABC transporter ATP-binding protein [Leptotrichia sp.]|jgi:iron(III) dicitrate ABC transporter, ATP-binding protein FecE|nr:ABC transporter ATP-binding protein [Leptotrichia sp.]